MAILKERKMIYAEMDLPEFQILNFAKYEKLLDSLENCTKKLEKLVEKTTELEISSNTRET